MTPHRVLLQNFATTSEKPKSIVFGGDMLEAVTECCFESKTSGLMLVPSFEKVAASFQKADEQTLTDNQFDALTILCFPKGGSKITFERADGGFAFG